MTVTNFGPGGFPLATAEWSTGVTSVNSNFTTEDGGFSATNFVQGITANGSNMLLRPIANFAAGSNIWLSLDAGPAGSVPSNTIRIHSTATVGGSIITSNGSNALAAIVNLKAGAGIALGVSGQDITITNAGAGSGGGGSAGALVLLEQHTASSSASLDFTTFISATYDEYLFEFIEIVPASSTVEFTMQAGTGGGPTYDTGSNYNDTLIYFGIGDVVTGVTQTSATSIFLAKSVTTTASYTTNGHLRMFNPGGGTNFKFFESKFQSVANTLYQWNGTSVYKSATAMTACRFKFSAGNIASGTIRVYGITKT